MDQQLKEGNIITISLNPDTDLVHLDIHCIMDYKGSKTAKYVQSLLHNDFKASITVFFVAVPLCLGISLASGAPVYSGIISGIIGGVIVSILSGSELSVSGPAAGLTAICAAAITQMGGLQLFFLSVSLAGAFQALLGIFRLGGFTHFIPSSVIKGMLAAIGIILISKQIPLLIGYDQPDFWTNELFNILTLDHAFDHLGKLYVHSSIGAVIISILSLLLIILWNKKVAVKLPFIPSSFIVVLFATILAFLFKKYLPSFQLKSGQFVSVPPHVISNIRFPDFRFIFSNTIIWKNAVVICFVATLETLLSLEAVDKLDPYNRISPQNRELMAQGSGNFLSGLLGGLPITAVIVRSSANVEAGARSKLSSFMHGIWLLVAILFGVTLINQIPYCVLAVILIRTGYNLAKPKMIRSVYRQGREQLLPFIVTITAILFTNLLIGVLIGIIYAIYFLIKHTYRAGYVILKEKSGNAEHYTINLALNVSFLNKKRFMEMLDKIPPGSFVTVNGSSSVYIDHDVLEVLHSYKLKAINKNIHLHLKDIPDIIIEEIH
jgi:MFS superfamily sulfate permease-like transporter